MKRSTGRHYNRQTRERYFMLYKFAKARGDEHVILRLALRNDISPCLLSRIILEEYYWSGVDHERLKEKPDGGKGSLPSGLITELLRDIAKVPDPNMARELYESMVLDNYYGPIIDSIKKCCGTEYEVMLTAHCKNVGLTFMDEDQMRREGFDKTPDIKLEIPIMINNRSVNWIESKASFGDPTNHQQYMIDQFLPYKNRYGNGVVIYWFGFVDELAEEDPGIQLLDKFPSYKDIIKLEDLIKEDKAKYGGEYTFFGKIDFMKLSECKPVGNRYNFNIIDPTDPMFDIDEEELYRKYGRKPDSDSDD